MANEEILKSYLLSIGFKIDEEGYKKFKDREEESSKRIKELSENLEKFAAVAAGSATILTASVLKITEKLTQLYYSSQIAGTSAQNLQAFKTAATQIGISAEGAQQAVENMAMSLRMNPQLGGILQGFNINPNQDKVEVLLELVDKLSQMPFYQAAQIGNMFGLDSQTLLMLEQHTGELHKYLEEYKKLNQGTTEQSAASRKFSQDLQDLEARFNKLWQVIATRLLPVGEEVIHFLDGVIDLLLQADKATDGWSSRILGIVSSIAGFIGGLKILRGALSFLGIGGGTAAGEAGGVAAGAGAGTALVGGAGVTAGLAGIGAEIFLGSPTLQKKFSDSFQGTALWRWLYSIPDNITPGNGAFNAPSGKGLNKSQEDIRDMVGNMAAALGIDPILAQAQAWAESRFKQSALSDKGAIGVMQLMPDTAKQLGVNPYSTEANISGGLHYLRDLLTRYGGDESLALAAYNAGSKAVDKAHGIPNFPETQKYVADILAYRLAHQGSNGANKVQIHQNTKIEVNGTGDPTQVARDVLSGQDRVNKDLQRAVSGVVDR